MPRKWIELPRFSRPIWKRPKFMIRKGPMWKFCLLSNLYRTSLIGRLTEIQGRSEFSSPNPRGHGNADTWVPAVSATGDLQRRHSERRRRRFLWSSMHHCFRSFPFFFETYQSDLVQYFLMFAFRLLRFLISFAQIWILQISLKKKWILLNEHRSIRSLNDRSMHQASSSEWAIRSTEGTDSDFRFRLVTISSTSR